jgi:predicted RNase H-like nuclease
LKSHYLEKSLNCFTRFASKPGKYLNVMKSGQSLENEVVVEEERLMFTSENLKNWRQIVLKQ